jgi:outer membrane protein TolC
MTRADGSHELRPEFRAHLEWQIQSALRRESRFAEPVPTRSPRLRTAAMLVLAMVVGGIAVGASTELQDARERQAVLEGAQSELKLIQLRVELARADFEQTRQRFEVGTVGRETLQAAERELRAQESALARLKLDIEETQSSSAAPRNDLQAPLVGNRDFVRERLMLDLRDAQRNLAAAEQAMEQARQRVEVGTAPQATAMAAELEVAQARAVLKQLQGTIELRTQAMAGAIKAEDVAALQRQMELTLHRDRLRREIELGRARIQDIRRQVETGMASQLDLKRAEVELLERETELQRVDRELQRVASPRRE